MTRMDRRKFVGLGVAAAAVGRWPARAPLILDRAVKPAVVSSRNGLPYMAGALERIGKGEDVLDAVIWAVNQVENDPNDMSVGYGGLPNEDGVVELDSCCMHGPSNNAGAVAALRNIKNPSQVARAVLWNLDHVLLVGEGALRFAKAMGFKEENLLTDRARARWLKWKRDLSPRDDWLQPKDKRPELAPSKKEGKRETGTINFNGVNAKGEVSGVTTTSGLAFKVPGRVGDSPLIGAGLYVDGKVGAAGSTGRGEAVIISCGSHTVVEGMRQGMHPKDACLFGIKRVAAMNTMPYLLDEKKRPAFQVNFYAVDVRGRVGGASLWPSRYARGDDSGAALVDSAHLFER